MARYITSADVVIFLTVPGLFTAPQQLQGFAPEDIFDAPDRMLAETAMGADGKQAGGYVPAVVEQRFMFMANSDITFNLFEAWATASRQNKTTYPCTGTTFFPSLQRTYNMINGILKTGSPMPSAKKTVPPRGWLISWEDVLPSPTA